ncbi:hypothetical protein [uncultured Hymenobacter sp.]|uniref:hypothetical protein n=1 Tax=uncultured Hymenobacter sp. TaxID=170016 RepID=UPI0035CB0D0F
MPRIWFLLSWLLGLSAAGPALAQTTDPATGAPAAARPAVPWYRPRHLLAQTGSGLGLLAVGAGYAFARDQVETDVLLGFVPRRYAGSSLLIPSLKLLYSPFKVELSESVQLRPLTAGLYVSHTYGIINDDRRKYSKGYYWFSADTRVGPLLGGRLSYQRLPATLSGRRGRQFSAYYELGSNDLYVISYYTGGNANSLRLKDILTLGIGVKADL